MSGQPRLERWLPVVNWEEAYEVSDRGRVRSMDRIIVRSDGVLARHRGRLRKLSPHGNGYLGVSLCVSSRSQRTYLIHVLVARAFLGPLPTGLETLHSNGDKFDNTVGNLRYGTHGDNMADMVAHGRHHMTRRSRCPTNHLLCAPNLVAKEGGRRCLACRRARADMRYAARVGNELDFAVVADRHYIRILEDALMVRDHAEVQACEVRCG